MKKTDSTQQIIRFNADKNEIQKKIVEMNNDPDFQELYSYYHKTTVLNVFGIERSENRHSSFLRWLIDSRSSHALGYEPVKKLLRLYALAMPLTENVPLQNLLLIGNYDIQFIEYPTTEKSIARSKNKKGRIDLWARMEISDHQNNAFRVILILENKVNSNEGEEQTNDYHTYLCQIKNADEIPIELYLTPEQTEAPGCSSFKHIHYSDLLKHVLEPLEEIVPDAHSSAIISDYIRNLSKPSVEDDGKAYSILATSEKERRRLESLYENYQDLFWPALLAGNMNLLKGMSKDQHVQIVEYLDKAGFVDKCPANPTDKECVALIQGMNHRELLESFWDANIDIFMAIIPIMQNQILPVDMDKVLKRSNRDTSKYDVYVDGKIYGQHLAKSRAALAVFKAYVEHFPLVDIKGLRSVFNGKLNDYYHSRLFEHLFYPASKVDPPFDIGKMAGKIGDIRWDFFYQDDELLKINNGTERVMVVRMWRAEAFDLLVDLLAKEPSLRFITVTPNQE